MHTVSLPQTPKVTSLGEYHEKFEIFGCYPGYGMTLGNALRRVLLSSLEGAAITSVKIKNVSHEFSTLPGVLEDVVQIILNLKKVRFRVLIEEPVKLTLKAKGEGAVTAADIKTTGEVEVVNADHLIATLTEKKAELELEMTVARGLGYVPVEQQERTDKEIGVIAMDAIYTPIKRVNYEIENMRVGKRTDFDKITLEIVTDGSMTPKEAFEKASRILIEQFSSLSGIATEDGKGQEEMGEDDFDALSTRTRKALKNAGYMTVEAVAGLSAESLGNLEGMGAKGVKEVKALLEAKGLSLVE